MRLASGERAAMDVLVSRYHGKLIDFAQRHLNDREASADVAQITLVRVFRCAASFRQQSSFKTWLYTIALNLTREELRRRKRKGVSLFSEMSGDESEIDLACEDVSPEDFLVGRAESVMLWQEVESLQDKHRTAVILRFRAELTYDEIAEVMKAPSGTVRSWVHYALKTLRKSLEREQK